MYKETCVLTGLENLTSYAALEFKTGLETALN